MSDFEYRTVRAANERIAELETKLCSMNDAGHKLMDENERLRKELARWRKGDCRRKIDKAMEGK